MKSARSAFGIGLTPATANTIYPAVPRRSFLITDQCRNISSGLPADFHNCLATCSDAIAPQAQTSPSVSAFFPILSSSPFQRPHDHTPRHRPRQPVARYALPETSSSATGFSPLVPSPPAPPTHGYSRPPRLRLHQPLPGHGSCYHLISERCLHFKMGLARLGLAWGRLYDVT